MRKRSLLLGDSIYKLNLIQKAVKAESCQTVKAVRKRRSVRRVRVRSMC